MTLETKIESTICKKIPKVNSTNNKDWFNRLKYKVVSE